MNYVKRVKNDDSRDIKLKIKENSINESLEKISDETYCTDYVGDVASWILNKPKPYRILYDKHFDIWCIADALENTHEGMSIDIFKSGYLLGLPKSIDRFIKFARSVGRYDSGWTDAEVYYDYGFNSNYLFGLFFIPNGDQYSNYEETSFYSKPTKISSGTIYTRRSEDFTDRGIFKDLYMKLGRMGAFDRR